MRLRRLLVSLSAVLSLGIVPSGAQAIDIGAGISSILIRNLKQQVSDLIGQAQASGDFLIWRAGTTILNSIDAWEHANSSLIDKADKKASEREKQFFDNLDHAITELRDGSDAVYSHARQLTFEWSQIASRTVALDGSADVFAYSPMFVLPEGDQEVRFGIDGPQLGNSDLSAIGPQGQSIPISKRTATHIDLTLRRGDLDFDKIYARQGMVHLTIKGDRRFWSLRAGDDRQRDLAFWILPEHMAHITVEPRVRVDTYEVATLPPMTASLKAHDATKPVPPDALIVPDAWKSQGYTFDMEAIARGPTSKFLTKQTGDGNGICLDIEPKNVHQDRIDYSIYAGSSGNGDATIFCRFELPVRKAVSKFEQGGFVEADIGWTKDLRLHLPANTESFLITVTMYNDRVFYVKSDEPRRPMGLLSFLRDRDDLILRPTPPPN